MTLADATTALNTKHDGAFLKIAYHTELPLKNEFKIAGITAYKTTEIVVRKGINYSSLKSVKEKIAAGLKITHELPWGTWSKAFPKLVIEHKGNNYIRFYLTKNHGKSIYYINNIPYTKEDLQKTGYIIDSYFTKTYSSPLINLNVENLDKVF